ncbi:MAG: DUF2341 domain-containing protein [Chloroflexota bacterium]|nr:DUF2341 domain-containing protein [Chloroflexota bacterium]
MLKVFRRERGFTLLEVVVSLSIVALITPGISMAILQTMTVPEATNAEMSISNSFSLAAEQVTSDSNEADVFIGVNDSEYSTYVPDGTESDYGAFVDIGDGSGVVRVVRYYFDNGNLFRDPSADGEPSTVVAGGIAEYDDVSFVTDVNGDAVLVTVALTEGLTMKQDSFVVALRSFDGFRYRRPITVTYNTGLTLEDRQVLVSLNATNFDFSHADDQGDDLRFPMEYSVYELPISLSGDGVDEWIDHPVVIEIADADALANIAQGNDLRFYTTQSSSPYGADGVGEDDSPLDYWLEDFSDTNMTVWVKVPSIPPEGTQIYMYYGNTFSKPKSDGSAFFDFYRNFDDGDISDWTPDKGSWDADNGYLASHSGEGWIAHNDFMTFIGQEFIAEIFCESPAASGAQGIIFGYQDKDNFYEAIMTGKDTIQLWKYTKPSGGGTNNVMLGEASFTPDEYVSGQWYVLRAQWISASEAKVFLEEMDGTILASIHVTLDMETWESGLLGVRGDREGGLDNLRVGDIDDGSVPTFYPTVTIGTGLPVPIDGGILLFTYAIQSWDPSGDTDSEVLITLPYVPHSEVGESDPKIYMYYGKDGVPSLDSGIIGTPQADVTTVLGDEQSI